MAVKLQRVAYTQRCRNCQLVQLIIVSYQGEESDGGRECPVSADKRSQTLPQLPTHTHTLTCTQSIALYLYLTAAPTHTCTHTRLETSVRMVYNSINFNMIPTVDRRAATQASERADKRLFFLNALYKRKLCTINLAERETERESAMTAAKCSDNSQRCKSKSSSRNCSANKYYAAGAEVGTAGGREAGPAAAFVVIVLLLFCRIFKLFKS